MKPLPRITPDNEPFYKAIAENRFVLPYCADCGKPHLPPGPVCPFCFSDRVRMAPGERPRPDLGLDGGAQGLVPGLRRRDSL